MIVYTEVYDCIRDEQNNVTSSVCSIVSRRKRIVFVDFSTMFSTDCLCLPESSPENSEHSKELNID